jgi:hypothetical protein
MLEHVDLEKPLPELVDRGSECHPEDTDPSSKRERAKAGESPVLPSAQAQKSAQVDPERKDQSE